MSDNGSHSPNSPHSSDPEALPDFADVGGDPLASIGQRVGARVIDWLLLAAVVAAMGMLAVSGDPQQTVPRWAVLGSVAVVFLYETLPVALRGQTIGKAVVGIDIVSLERGTKPGLVAAGLRALPIVLLLVLLQQFSYIVMVFVYFTAAFMQHNRGVLDRLAGTVVIQGRRRGLFG